MDYPSPIDETDVRGVGYPQGSSLRTEGRSGPEDFEGENGKSTSEKMGLWKCLGEGDIPREGPDGWRRAFAWP